jgi:hypothetical protein
MSLEKRFKEGLTLFSLVETNKKVMTEGPAQSKNLRILLAKVISSRESIRIAINWRETPFKRPALQRLACCVKKNFKSHAKFNI